MSDKHHYALNGTYTNPYKGCDKADEVRKITAVIPADRWVFIKSIRVEDGTIQTTLNIFWEKLYHELIKRGITSILERERFEHFITNFEFSLPGSATARPLSETDGRNDGSRASRVRGGSEASPDVGADVASSVAEGRGDADRKKPKRKTAAGKS